MTATPCAASCRGACRLGRRKLDDCQPGGPFLFAVVRRPCEAERLTWTLPVHLQAHHVSAVRLVLQGDDLVAAIDHWAVAS